MKVIASPRARTHTSDKGSFVTFVTHGISVRRPERPNAPASLMFDDEGVMDNG